MTLKAAVIGVGQIGRHHARVYRSIEKVELVAVVDADPTAFSKLTRSSQTRGYVDYRQMLEAEAPDLVSVCVPTKLHCEIAREILQRGIAVLAEKPLAVTVAEGEQMISAAETGKAALMVGHIERFNPAIIEVKRRLETKEIGQVYQLHARRLSPFPARVQDVGVVLDLASHDIDVMRYLTGANVARVYAETASRVQRGHEDMLSGLLRFSDGAIGVLDINWLMPAKIRQLTIIGESGAYIVDYLTQDLYWHQDGNVPIAYEAINVVRGPSEGDVVKVQIRRREPLQVELEAFVDTVLSGNPAPVSGLDGIATLRLANSLIQSGQMHQMICLEPS